MTPELIRKFAQQAGFSTIDGPAEWMRDPNDNHARISVEEYEIRNELAAFAALVAAHQRELDAKVAENYQATWQVSGKEYAAAIWGTK